MKLLLSDGLMAAALSGLGLGAAEAHPRLVPSIPSAIILGGVTTFSRTPDMA